MSLQLIAVGTPHCRVIYIIPVLKGDRFVDKSPLVPDNYQNAKFDNVC